MDGQKNHNIPGRDITLISLVLVILMAVISVMYYRSERKRIISKEFHELALTNKLKENHILSWRNYQLSFAKSYAGSPLFAGTVTRYFANMDMSRRAELLEQCEAIRKYRSYHNVLIADTAGNVAVSLNEREARLDSATMVILKEAEKTGNAVVGSISVCPADNSLYVDVVCPVIGDNGTMVGFLVLRVDPVKEIVTKFRADPALGDSTRSYLVFSISNKFFALKSDCRTSLASELISLTEADQMFPIFQTGDTQYIGEDLAHHKVLAHVQPVSGTPWFIFSQSEYGYVLSQFHRYAIIDSVVTSVLIILILVSLVLVYQFRQKALFKNLFYTELAFKEEHERFRTTLYSIGDGVITTDESGFIIHMNKEASRLTGWAEAAANGKQVNEVFSIEDEESAEWIKCPVDQVLRRGVVVDLSEKAVLRPHGGHSYPISYSAAPILNDSNEIIGAVLVFRDQTRQRAAEKKLKKNEASLRKAERVARVGHWEANTLHKEVTLSEGAVAILGLDSGVHSVENIKELLCPESADMLSSAVVQLVYGGVPVAVEVEIKRPADEKVITVHLAADYNAFEKTIFGIIQDITDRKQAEKDLIESKERWRNLFDYSPSAIAIYKAVDGGRDFMFTDINKTSQTVDNVTREDVVGHYLSELFPSAEELGFLDIFRRVWSTGKTEYMGTTHYKDDRMEGWRDNTIYRLNTGEIVAIYNDVTTQKTAELKLAESEEKFRSIFEEHSAVKLIIDPDTGQITDANKAAESFYGWSLEEIKNMKLSELNVAPVEVLKNNIDSVINHRQVHFELKHRLKDGTVKDVEVYSSTIRIQGKDYIHSIIHDISSRKAAEVALKESEFFLRKSQEAAKVGSYKFNIKNGFWAGSDVLDEVFGLSENRERSVEEWVMVIHPDFREEMSRYLAEDILKQKRRFDKEYRIVRVNDNQARWVHGLGELDFDENDSPVELYGTIQDITEQKMLEQKVLTTVVETEERERLSFSQELHDGLGPLISAIKMYLELLAMPNSETDYRNFIDNAGKLINEATGVVREISFRLSPHILQNYGIEEALKSFSEKVKKGKPIDISINSSITCKLDRITETVIYRVLSECINNTVKHADAGKISVNMLCSGDILEINYSDDGKGFDIEKTSLEHRGVGLLNMESRIRSISGSIKISSRIGEGTSINIKVKTNPN